MLQEGIHYVFDQANATGGSTPLPTRVYINKNNVPVVATHAYPGLEDENFIGKDTERMGIFSKEGLTLIGEIPPSPMNTYTNLRNEIAPKFAAEKGYPTKKPTAYKNAIA